MLLALPDQKSNTILVNWDRVTYAFQSGPNTVTTLKTPEGDIYLNVGIEELEEAVRAEEQRLANLTKTAR